MESLQGQRSQSLSDGDVSSRARCRRSIVMRTRLLRSGPRSGGRSLHGFRDRTARWRICAPPTRFRSDAAARVRRRPDAGRVSNMLRRAKPPRNAGCSWFTRADVQEDRPVLGYRRRLARRCSDLVGNLLKADAQVARHTAFAQEGEGCHGSSHRACRTSSPRPDDSMLPEGRSGLAQAVRDENYENAASTPRATAAATRFSSSD